MRRHPPLFCAALLGTLLVAGCGADPEDAAPPAESPAAQASPDAAEAAPTPDPTPSEETATAGGDACALLDPDVLDDVTEGATTLLGTPFEFQEGLPAPSGGFCTWKEGNTGLSIQLTLEPAATASIDDHSGRAYNIDVEPEVQPQDGPGTSAVLLADPAFEDSTGDTLPYGYFFVSGEQTVFVKSVGLELEPAQLRALADAAAARLPSG